VLDRAKSNDWEPEETLRGLLAHHVHFAVTEPDRIRVQEREGGNLAPEQSAKVRSLQRLYMVLWVDALRELQPELTSDEAQLKVQLTAGLINSSRHVLKWAGPEATRENAFEMALAALCINNQ
ncbi:TetR/AcrR family transcriptional regulator, partial [Corynebacterium amycolatum]|nr:TetR/AcrR family transcriptional regulator [Corynebacterium amycolatum]